MIIIPDVHGRPFWIQAARDLGGKEHFVFLGDYLDPYGYEGITPEMAFDIFQEVLDFKEAWPDKVTLLLGNHDLHYLDDRLEGGRYDSVRGMFIRELILDHADWFRMAFETEAGGKKFLLTHAGVYQIFGHSQQEFRPVICDHFACLDVRAPFRLTAEGEIVKLENTDGDL